jgi:mono/diheme cytochrome c family protein
MATAQGNIGIREPRFKELSIGAYVFWPVDNNSRTLVSLGLVAVLLIASMRSELWAQAHPADSGASATAEGSPLETAKTAEKGALKNPYSDHGSVAEAGKQIYLAAGYNGCHGMGGGGMAPPSTNEVWIYAKGDDTLFRLIALGSDDLQKQGYTRRGSENVVGPMPPFGGIIKSNDDMWKMISWIRSVNPDSGA